MKCPYCHFDPCRWGCAMMGQLGPPDGYRGLGMMQQQAVHDPCTAAPRWYPPPPWVAAPVIDKPSTPPLRRPRSRVTRLLRWMSRRAKKPDPRGFILPE